MARDRNPGADIRVGDMHALPWDDGAFDVVTSFRGIWGTTPEAVAEVRRVLAPGGRLGITVWGHIKASPGGVGAAAVHAGQRAQGGEPGGDGGAGPAGRRRGAAGRAGFVDIERVDIPFAWEFADPEAYARALASTGPAYEAIQAVGEEAFVRVARSSWPRSGPRRAAAAGPDRRRRLPRPQAAAPAPTARAGAGFLAAGAAPATERLFDEDVAELGYVMNVSRLWAHLPAAQDGLFDADRPGGRAGSLTFRQRGILVTACASTLGDSYCSLAWGNKLAGEAGGRARRRRAARRRRRARRPERALAAWARRSPATPTRPTPATSQALRDAGFDDAQIFAITVFVALRHGVLDGQRRARRPARRGVGRACPSRSATR